MGRGLGVRHPTVNLRRRFRQRAAGAWGGFQEGLVIASVKKTPGEGFRIFPALADAKRPWGFAPNPTSLFEKGLSENFTYPYLS